MSPNLIFGAGNIVLSVLSVMPFTYMVSRLFETLIYHIHGRNGHHITYMLRGITDITSGTNSGGLAT